MSRLRRIADRDRIFFVTTNLASRADALTSTERDLVVAQMDLQRAGREFLLFGYVVMPTHLHLLLSPDQCGLIVLMRRLKRFTALRIAKGRRTEGGIWQARYFDFILRRVGDFWDKLEYIHENPVEATLTRVAADWPWSSAAQYGGGSASPLEIDRIDLPVDRKTLLYPAPWR